MPKPRRPSPYADERGLIWKRMRRDVTRGVPRFLTFSCTQRKPLFHRPATRDHFLRTLEINFETQRVALHAFVVMPEHVHLLVTPQGDALPAFLRRLKSTFARETLTLWRVHRPAAYDALASPDGPTRFWQPGGGFDRTLRTPEQYDEKLIYIHQNPVKRGLCERAEDYRWSSAWEGT